MCRFAGRGLFASYLVLLTTCFSCCSYHGRHGVAKAAIYAFAFRRTIMACTRISPQGYVRSKSEWQLPSSVHVHLATAHGERSVSPAILAGEVRIRFCLFVFCLFVLSVN
jgi:hypothetical protein